MKLIGKLENIEKIEATLTITMPLSEWKDLQEGLKTKYPDWKLSNAIDDLFSKAKRSWAANVGDPQ